MFFRDTANCGLAYESIIDQLTGRERLVGKSFCFGISVLFLSQFWTGQIA